MSDQPSGLVADCSNRSDVTPAPVAESTARPAAKAEAAAPQRSRVDAAASATLAALLRTWPPTTPFR